MTHIMVALNSHPRMAILLNAAARQASQTNSSWHVVYVETPTHLLRGEAHQQAILRHMTKAEEKGATIHRIEAQDVQSGLLSYFNAQTDDAIECWMGKPAEGFQDSWFRRPLYTRLQEKAAGHVTLHPVPLHGRGLSTHRYSDIFRLRAVKASHIIYSLVSVLIAFLATELMRSTMSAGEFSESNYNTTLLLIVPPIAMGLRFGLIPALLAALGGFLTLNYFYIHPIYRLEIDEYHDMINGVLFFAIAIGMALLGSYSYAYAASIQRRERRSQALFAINSVISKSMSREQALESIHEQISHLLEMKVALFLPPVMNPNVIEQVYPSGQDSLSAYDTDALNESWSCIRSTGCGTGRFAKTRWRFCPMMTAEDRLGVLAVHIPKNYELDVIFGVLMTTLADQAANVLERIELSKEVEARHISEEREKLRSMLLSSVSHDLKTPLASVIGSLSVYQSMANHLPDHHKQELIQTALDEAQRLNSFITNILDMTRIESGQVQLAKEWIDPMQLVKSVRKHLKQSLRNHQLELVESKEKILVEADPVMTEQILQNLLDNASKYTPAGGTIYAEYAILDDALHFMIRDSGNGIPEDKLTRIFDKYERIRQQDRKVAGTGLGLAIAKAVMEAQGGAISAHNHAQGGAVFSLIFPRYEIQQKGDEAPA